MSWFENTYGDGNFYTDPGVDRSAHLKAQGSLTYLEFIDIVKYLWEQAHPDVYLVANQGTNQQDLDRAYIVYSLELRRAVSNEPKRKFREKIWDSESNKWVWITGQRFLNIVAFTIIHTDPRVAEEVIEVFERFMTEYTPVFKAVGASDFLYARRLADSQENRQGSDISKRTVTYQLTTEIVEALPVDTIKEIVFNIRVMLTNSNNMAPHPLIGATPNIDYNIVDDYQAFATPNF